MTWLTVGFDLEMEDILCLIREAAVQWAKGRKEPTGVCVVYDSRGNDQGYGYHLEVPKHLIFQRARMRGVTGFGDSDLQQNTRSSLSMYSKIHFLAMMRLGFPYVVTNYKTPYPKREEHVQIVKFDPSQQDPDSGIRLVNHPASFDKMWAFELPARDQVAEAPTRYEFESPGWPEALDFSSKRYVSIGILDHLLHADDRNPLTALCRGPNPHRRTAILLADKIREIRKAVEAIHRGAGDDQSLKKLDAALGAFKDAEGIQALRRVPGYEYHVNDVIGRIQAARINLPFAATTT